MARRRNKVAPKTVMVTPVIETPKSRSPLTFGSFLPEKFQPIQEKEECEEEIEDECNRFRPDNPYGKRPMAAMVTLPRKLQFSDVRASTSSKIDEPVQIE
ncbi:hypothetical protein P3L10_019453 [Capsicum annuum]